MKIEKLKAETKRRRASLKNNKITVKEILICSIILSL
jgi:hypothetical protein